MNLSDAELALIGTLFGSAGLKIIEWLLGRRDKAIDHGAQMREELRTEVTGLREQLAAAKEDSLRLEDEVEEWRSKFYDMRDDNIKRQTDLMIATSKIETLLKEIEECKARVSELEKKYLPHNNDL